MDFEDQLSSGQMRKDQGPNKALAQRISDQPDLLDPFLEYLASTGDKALKTDGLMALRALSEIDPPLLSNHVDIILQHLDSSVNQRVWAGMIILNKLAGYYPQKIRPYVSKIIDCMGKGSVITRDHGFSILCTMYKRNFERKDMEALIREQLLLAPDNQVGQYAEKYMEVIDPQDLAAFEISLNERSEDLYKPAHRKRLNRILLKLRKLTIQHEKN